MDGLGISYGPGLFDVVLKLRDPLLQLSNLSLTRLKFAIQGGHQRIEASDACLLIEKRIRVDQGDLAVGYGPAGLRLRRRTRWLCLRENRGNGDGREKGKGG